MKKRLEHLIKTSLFFQKIYKFFGSVFFRFIGLFLRVDEKLIIFTGHGGKINDSSLSIYNQIRNDRQFLDYTIVWGINKKYIKDYTGHNVVIIDSFKYFKTALKAKYWIASVNIERGLNFKKRKTKYLNTWHGIPLKKIGNSASKRKDYDFSNIDLFCVSSDYEVDIYTKDFRVNPSNIIKTGMPRNDILFKTADTNYLDGVRKELGIKEKNKKIILYAPTWRESNTKGRDYDIAPPISFNLWKEKLKQEYIVLLRMHPYTTKVLNVTYDDFIIDASNYGDINDLIQLSDMLITDYSAIFFDYAITEKPIHLFIYDYEEYKKSRGLYFDMKSKLNEIVVSTENELLNKIISDKTNEKIMQNIKKEFHKYSGNSTEKCIEELFFSEERG